MHGATCICTSIKVHTGQSTKCQFCVRIDVETIIFLNPFTIFNAQRGTCIAVISAQACTQAIAHSEIIFQTT